LGALFVGMLSELVYTSSLGLLGGLAYGEWWLMSEMM
jgi:hypothetical protein